MLKDARCVVTYSSTVAVSILGLFDHSNTRRIKLSLIIDYGFFGDQPVSLVDVEQRAREGMVASGNTYYTDGEPVFLLGQRKLTLEEFRIELGVEKDSVVKPASEFQLP